jgi:hypothetical protein
MPWEFYEIKPLIQNIGRRLKAGRACWVHSLLGIDFGLKEELF